MRINGRPSEDEVHRRIFGPDRAPGLWERYEVAYSRRPDEEELRRLILAQAANAAQGKPVVPGVAGIHPRALALVGRCGIVQPTRTVAKEPGARLPEEQPFPNQCYRNALEIMLRHNWDGKQFCYVEGVAFECGYRELFSHGWNSLGTAEEDPCIDYTMYARSPFMLYVGIPFSSDEHAALSRLLGEKHRRTVPLFRDDRFPVVEAELRRLLIERRVLIGPA